MQYRLSVNLKDCSRKLRPPTFETDSFQTQFRRNTCEPMWSAQCGVNSQELLILGKRKSLYLAKPVMDFRTGHLIATTALRDARISKGITQSVKQVCKVYVLIVLAREFIIELRQMSLKIRDINLSSSNGRKRIFL